MAYAFESGSLSAAADCLDRAETTLCQAQSTSAPGQRYVLAHTPPRCAWRPPCSQLVPSAPNPGAVQCVDTADDGGAGAVRVG